MKTNLRNCITTVDLNVQPSHMWQAHMPSYKPANLLRGFLRPSCLQISWTELLSNHTLVQMSLNISDHNDCAIVTE